MSVAPSVAQPYDSLADDAAMSASLDQSASITAALEAGQVQGRTFSNISAIKAFYAQRDNKPYWLRGFFSSSDDELLEILKEAWTHGLNPEAYHVDMIEELDSDLGLANKAERELLLTDAFVRYAQDLSGMRIDPRGLKLDPRSWRQRMSAEDVLSLLIAEGDFEDVIEKLQPQSRTYELLRKELVALTKAQEPDYAAVLPLRFGRTLRANTRHPRMNDLRVRLGVEPLTSDERLYDDRLVGAVIKFQRENEMPADGDIGPLTLQALNRTNADLLRQVIVNLERLRWAPEARPEKYIVVNVPSATLWAVDDNKLEFEMPVIVGRPKRPTEAFIADIKGVRFNPNWTVPPTIQKKDMLPKLQENPEYFANKGIEIYTGYGRDAQTLDPAAIDWETVTQSELLGLRMVQSPGRHNALGQIRVLMPNRFNIYLHDTNEKYLFNRSARAVSSGCIRLKDPMKVASFIMRDKEDWSDEVMQGVLASRKTKERYIPETIPVYIFYYTTWIDKDGQVIYGSDIYKQDQMVFDKLAKLDGFAIPGHNIKIEGNSARSKLVSVN